MNHILLTESQLKNLIDFIEVEFIDSIRRDECIDNIDYVIDMMNTLQILRYASHNNTNRRKVACLCKFN